MPVTKNSGAEYIISFTALDMYLFMLRGDATGGTNEGTEQVEGR